ncbi:TPA: hypothetical protein SL838_002187, partial [Pseudomonas aeruginosa]|nr:hypothetical protein [Pseudomonas aeruginosa]HCE7726943.1 hypothetical protein [Pseudomonas aeruginosa]HCF2370373.1 hypothetical protein [Pseudomonas aeruginosa]HCL3894702.1 hypothetical protein [Pseudomonas aeruginosa]HEJ6286517.1 hypothetical protein [Pseudomonas aeruginosa]
MRIPPYFPRLGALALACALALPLPLPAQAAERAWSYSYNALGQRIVKLTPESITTYLYGPDG